MRILSKNDLAEVTIKSLIADYDRETLINLYQPIIGYEAVGLYFTLLSEGKNQKVYALNTHEEIMMKMQISTGHFVDARKALEAVGLLKTYLLKDNESVLYHYDVFAPKTPYQFFDNALLYGMLIKCLGLENVKKIKMLYPGIVKKDYGEDISCKFTDVFAPKFDDPAFLAALNNNEEAIGRNAGKIEGNFSYEVFFQELSKISQIKVDAFTKTDMKEIFRIATLYGIDEKAAANHVANIYNPNEEKGKHIDYKELNKLFQNEVDYKCSVARKNVNTTENNVTGGSSALAQKINILEKTPPKKYLALMQNGTKPALADLRLINDLSRDFNLTNPVINVIIDYVLTNCENVLSRAYAEKVAASLARDNVQTAIDAMNYLIKVSKNKRGNKKVVVQVNKENETNQDEIENSNPQSGVNDKSWDDILDDIDQGGSDGKA